MDTIQIQLNVGGVSTPVQIQQGSEIGQLRTERALLEEIGAPGEFRFAVNGVQVEDTHQPADGDIVTLRPLTGEKGV